MAIRIQAKNRTVTVTDKYVLQVGKSLTKKAKKLNLEATRETLVLASSKKVVTQGGH